MEAEMPPYTLTKQSDVLAVLRAGGRIEDTGNRGLLRLVDAHGDEIPAWQNAIKAARAKAGGMSTPAVLKGYPNFPNKAHQRAYENGVRAAEEGKGRFPPYDCGNRSSLHFRKAWLAGYDGAITRVEGGAE